MDCQWIEKNLEALFYDTLNAEESRLARGHIENCAACRKEVDGLRAIDPLVKKYFQRELEIARRPGSVHRALHRGRLLGLSTAAASLVAVLLFLVLRVPQPGPIASVQPEIAPAASVEPTAPVKTNGTGEVDRTKPAAAPNTPADRQPTTQAAIAENAPDFLVTDPAGYSYSLDQFRKHVVVIGLWNDELTQATANLDRLYQTYGADPKFRFLGVASGHSAKPANTIFPIVYNEGSKLLGAHSGEFVVVDENGGIKLRGNLVTDFDSLRKALQGN